MASVMWHSRGQSTTLRVYDLQSTTLAGRRPVGSRRLVEGFDPPQLHKKREPSVPFSFSGGPAETAMPYYVYILVSERDRTLYTGQTKDLRRRIQRHNKGLIKSTKGRVPYTLQYFEEFASRPAAMAREWELLTALTSDCFLGQRRVTEWLP